MKVVRELDPRKGNNILDSGSDLDYVLEAMAWTVPQFKTQQVDAAGATIINPNASRLEWGDALDVINNWRSSHSFPLNTFQMGLRTKARGIDANCLVAQRIKRLRSIRDKLARMKRLSLSEMQDIGGCRAVVRDIRHVRELVHLYKKSSIKHKLIDEDDYIQSPKNSGYRGYHLIYRYYSDKKDTYNGLKIEMQIRSPLQHAWATAVEIVGTFTAQALKASRGQKEWLRFFSLMSSALAVRERTPLAPETPRNRKELITELKGYVQQLDVERLLHAYGAALRTQQEGTLQDAHYFLIHLDPNADTVTVTGYAFDELKKAEGEYAAVERRIINVPGMDAVLVSVDSLESLRRAYPNYFLDTDAFVAAVRRAVQEG